MVSDKEIVGDPFEFFSRYHTKGFGGLTIQHVIDGIRNTRLKDLRPHLEAIDEIASNRKTYDLIYWNVNNGRDRSIHCIGW